MRVLHISTYAGNGGAGRAAESLHLAMLDSGVESSMLVAASDSPALNVKSLEGLSDLHWRVAQALDRKMWNFQSTADASWHSPAVFGTLNAHTINALPIDVVNLHWVTNGFMSVRQIGRINKPIVWSLYDMWPFAGTEHYGRDTPDARWRTGYSAANRLMGESGLDLDRYTWKRKMRHWSGIPITGVAASAWMADRLATSSLGGSWGRHQIPHIIDTEAFQPSPKRAAREHLGLDVDIPLVVFISSGGVLEERKGWDLLDKALIHVRAAIPAVQVAIVGPVSADYQSLSGVPIHWLGHVSNNIDLQYVYAAADVVAVPSREDNMPLTAMEAQSCGIPVVAFGIGGLTDIIEHSSSGYLAKPYSIEDLATGLIAALGESRSDWGRNARARATSKWAPQVVVNKYLEAYSTALATSTEGS